MFTSFFWGHRGLLSYVWELPKLLWRKQWKFNCKCQNRWTLWWKFPQHRYVVLSNMTQYFWCKLSSLLGYVSSSLGSLNSRCSSSFWPDAGRLKEQMGWSGWLIFRGKPLYLSVTLSHCPSAPKLEDSTRLFLIYFLYLLLFDSWLWYFNMSKIIVLREPHTATSCSPCFQSLC